MFERVERNSFACAAAKILLDELKVLKNDTFDVDAANKYLDKQIREKEMANTFKTAVAECLELTKDKSEDYAKESGVSVEECDPKHEMMIICPLCLVSGVR